MPEHSELWLLGLRTAGVLHFVTLAIACFTPIPPDWERNLAALPDTHRRFAIAQNVFIGGVIAYGGVISLAFAPELLSGTPLARAVCAGLALWWAARLAVLPWLNARPHLRTTWLRAGFALLHVECALFAAGYAWLAIAPRG